MTVDKFCSSRVGLLLMYFNVFRCLNEIQRNLWPVPIVMKLGPKRVREGKYIIFEVLQGRFFMVFSVFHVFPNIRKIHRSSLFVICDGDKGRPDGTESHV